MASTYKQAIITTSAGSLIMSNTSRKKLVFTNTGNNACYIGNTGSVVTTANNANGGYPIEVNETFYLNDYTGDVYGICSAGSAVMHIIEEEL